MQEAVNSGVVFFKFCNFFVIIMQGFSSAVQHKNLKVARTWDLYSKSDKLFVFCSSQALGSHGNSAVEVDRDTAERMGRIQASYRTNRETVLNELLRHVCEIKPEFHANYRVAG